MSCMNSLLPKEMIKWAHVATIALHLLICLLLFLFIALDMKVGAFITNIFFLLVTILSLIPILRYSYVCQRNGTDLLPSTK